MNWRRLSLFGGAVAALHVAGWGLLAYYARTSPALVGLGTLAYTFGLRHAFDADHIAAIDNTTRKFRQEGQKPLGVGFFFSLGLALSITGLGLVAVLAKRRFAGRSFDGLLVRALPAVSAAVILAAGVVMTVHAIPKVHG